MTIPIPTTSYHFIELENTTLHCVKCGEGGPPLIMVPAMVSKIEQWTPFAQYMGQRFTTYFFELPGHGESTPYPEAFSTYLVPRTVEHLLEYLEIDRFTLMGFSFGGLLGLRTLDYLLPRIDRMILVSPALDKDALLFSPFKQAAFKAASSVLKYELIKKSVIGVMHADRTNNAFAEFISKVTNIDKQILVEKEIKHFPESTLEVMAASMNELLNLNYHSKHSPFTLPTYFGMSLYDDLIDYDKTLEIVEGLFTNLKTEQFSLPYHQPPVPYTFEEMVENFGQFLEMID
ncbi:MAG: alpha/beta hydrolase [Chloroflexota bacterium]